MFYLPTLKKILIQKPYLGLFGFMLVMLLFLFSYLQNASSVNTVWQYSVELSKKLTLTFDIITNLYIRNLPAYQSAAYLLLVVGLSLNIVCVIFYFRQRRQVLGVGGLGLSGLMTLFGLGCASCGTALLGVVANAALVGALPFGGQEFTALALVISLVGLRSILRKIEAPNVC